VRRIYFDSMLFIYWIESHPVYGAKVERLYERFRRQGDEICTSVLTIGEVLVIPVREQNLRLKLFVETFFDAGTVSVLLIDRDVVERFATIRAATKIALADALHLACAGSHQADVFLTNDKNLLRQNVADIGGICDLDDKTL